MCEYWVGDCPIAGPFDLWRKNYFLQNGVPPEDTAEMYPSLKSETVISVARAAVIENASLNEVLLKHEDCNSKEQVMKAYAYFCEWRKHAPFMPDSWQDAPLRPARTSPEPLEEFLDDWRKSLSDENYQPRED